MDAFKVLLSSVHGQRYEASVAVKSDLELTDLLRVFGEESNDRIPILSRTPEWVAARLWEIALAGDATTSVALRRWVDWWGILQHPLLVPETSWNKSDAKAFREAAIDTIATEPSLNGWVETRARYVQRVVLARSLRADVADLRLPQPPDTLVGRALWATSGLVEASAYDSLEICRDPLGLVGLLLADVDAQENAPAPHPILAEIIDLSVDRAEILIYLLFHIRARPRLLADLVIHPPGAALACLLIAQWSSPAGAWDRGLVERDHQIGQAEAFTDAVAILGEHLRTGKTNASEAAALLKWLHGRAGPGFIDDIAGADSLIAALRIRPQRRPASPSVAKLSRRDPSRPSSRMAPRARARLSNPGRGTRRSRSGDLAPPARDEGRSSRVRTSSSLCDSRTDNARGRRAQVGSSRRPRMERPYRTGHGPRRGVRLEWRRLPQPFAGGQGDHRQELERAPLLRAERRQEQHLQQKTNRRANT